MLIAHLTSFDMPSFVIAIGLGFMAGVAATLIATRTLARRHAEEKV